MITKKLIYLASPYSHKSKKVMKQRAIQISKIAAILHRYGVTVFCPIAHSVMLAKHGKIKGSFNEWMKDDYLFLEKCDELWVCELKGYDKSVGVLAEIKATRLANKPVRFFKPKDIDVFITKLIRGVDETSN